MACSTHLPRCDDCGQYNNILDVLNLDTGDTVLLCPKCYAKRFGV